MFSDTESIFSAIKRIFSRAETIVGIPETMFRNCREDVLDTGSKILRVSDNVLRNQGIFLRSGAHILPI